MTPAQEHALANVCRSQEAIQAAWDQPRWFNLNTLSNRQALVVTIVVEDGQGYHWMSCVRIYHTKKRKVKEPQILSPLESTQVGLILVNELQDVGRDETAEWFTSTWASHVKKTLTAAEVNIILRPDILGKSKTNGHKKLETSKDSALNILDNLAKGLDEAKDSRIIKPNSGIIRPDLN